MSDALDNDEFAFWRFNDLVERRIVTNRQDLSVKQREFGFPRPVRLAADGRRGVALFERRAVMEWVKQRLQAAKRRDERSPPAKQVSRHL